MAKVAVVYWSGTGNTEAMADLIADAASAAGAEVERFTADEFSADQLGGYDRVAFGCPAMGDEELEEDEFRPMYDACRPELKGREVAIFGSYNWAEGEWMEKWAAEIKEDGAVLVADPLICLDDPSDDDEIASCKALGEALAG